MYMSSQHTQLAQTNTTTSKDDAVANKKTTCPWSKCTDHTLQAVAAFPNNRSDVNRLVRTNRQYHRAVNKLLYKFDLRDDSKPSSALFWACCRSKVDTAKMAREAGADPNTEHPRSLRELLGKHVPEFDLSRGMSTRNALYVVASLGDVAMARLLLEFAQADFSKPVRYTTQPFGAGLYQSVRYEDPPLFSAGRQPSVVRALCDDPRVDINLPRAATTRAPVFYALTQFLWHIVDVLGCARGNTTTFDEARLDYWYKTSYALLNECKYWQMVEPELNQQKKAFLRSWQQDSVLLWGEHATRSIERGENGGI
ncbi:hypothetical protein MY4824_009543 [Beauveria thailandica]